jgi:hypothetical protein
MLEAAGFEVLERGCLVSTMEWPDAELAWHALASQGPAVPALRHGDLPCCAATSSRPSTAVATHRGVYRLRNDHQFLIAQRPGGGNS